MAPVPSVFGFKAYKKDDYRKILVASTRSFLHTLKWIYEIEIAKLKKLEKPKTEEWDGLEIACAEAVMDAVNGPLKKELLLYKQ